MIALIDCNSFYVSCEKAFQPKLKDKPVIVLSNNDGCIVSRSDEAKKLGVPMGEPFFKVKDLIAKHDIKYFSSNYALYGDMSSRVMKVLSEFTPDMEVYSIDEAFLNLDGMKDFPKLGCEIRTRVTKLTGIPVSVGIAPTKVLAKVANHIAKKTKSHQGVVCLESDQQIKETLEDFPVEDIWGIGWNLQNHLHHHGVFKVPQLLSLPETMIRKWLHVQVSRIVKELKGISCLEINHVEDPNKQIMSTRSFGKIIHDIGDLREAVSCHITTAAEKLRRQNSIAHTVTVFIRTGRHDKISQYYGSDTASLNPGTASTNKLIHAGLAVLEKIYKSGVRYKKCGIYLSGIQPKNRVQHNLFSPSDTEKDERLMKAVDHINRKQGRNTIQFASCGIYDHNWAMKSDHRSPCYTTRWSDVLTVQ